MKKLYIDVYDADGSSVPLTDKEISKLHSKDLRASVDELRKQLERSYGDLSGYIVHIRFT